MANWLVVSPNGFGNIGDDMVANAGRFAISQVDPDAKIKLSRPPASEKLIDWADNVILSGGGIIYDRAPKNLENYMDYIDLAHRKGKKSAVLGVGIQGIVTEEGKRRYKESLDKCEFVSVRTEKDKQMLADIGYTKAHATFDIAFLTPKCASYTEPKLRWTRVRKRQKLRVELASSQKPKVGICMINLRMLKGDSYEGVFSRFDEVIEEFIKSGRSKFDIYMIQHAKEDGDLMQKLAKRYDIPFVPYKNLDDLESTFNVYRHLDLMIGVRLHSIALGLMTDTPTIAIGSAHAKQKRLVDYAVPSMKENFYDFKDVEALSERLTKIANSGEIDVKPISKKDKETIYRLNEENLDLLRTLL